MLRAPDVVVLGTGLDDGAARWIRSARAHTDDGLRVVAIDVDASGTRREELLLGREELAITWKLRRVLSGMDDQAALEMLLKQLRKTQSNHEFLVQISRTTP